MCFRISRSIQSSSASVPEDERSGGLEHAAKRKARILTGDESQQNTEETRHDHTPDRGYCRQDRFGWKRKLSHTVFPACRFAPDYFFTSTKRCAQIRENITQTIFLSKEKKNRG